ncbi:BQ5605_C040g11881 [Microbotryum silenes-dioicae]|uniref:BQ5605_C040g11881 protein n=1 Tax=Microbotryum silenes-dioicae TaxID=796604 RepID=A0A2X0NIH6_9BASI|nr:BQ5605_C040g11881 [Microbotryum silenes-dioicae]
MVRERALPRHEPDPHHFGTFLPRSCLLLVAFSSLALHCAYSALVAAVINIFYVVFEWRMVLDHDSQKTRIARRSTIYFPMVLGGLLCSFSLLQAFVVVLSRKRCAAASSPTFC